MGAVDGVKVIDLTRILGGPFGTQWLADHGADNGRALDLPQPDATARG